MTRTRRRHQAKHQLRICMDFSTSTSSNSSSSGSGSEQGQLETLFPFSPSLSSLAALLEDIGDPQRLLYETIAAPELKQVSVALTKATQLDEVTNKPMLSPVVKHDAGQKMLQSSATQGVKRAPPTIVLASGGGAAGAKRRPRMIFKLSHDASEKREAIVNASRARQKEEMVYLHEKAITLERELLRLGKKANEPGYMAPPTITAVATTTTNSGRVAAPHRPIWQRLANSAKDAKYHSEVENLQLRQTLEKQAKLSKSIGKLLTKSESLTRSSSPPFQATPSMLLPSSTDDQDLHVFQDLSAQLDFQYQRLDIVMRETGLAQRTLEGSQSKIRDLSSPSNSSGGADNDGGDVMIECCDVKHYPFTPEAVGEVGWSCLTSQVTKNNANIFTRVVHQTESVAWTATSVTIQRLNGPDVVMSVKSVLKRYVEQNRRVMILNSVANLKPFGCEDTAANSGLQFFDQGWGTIESMSNDDRYPASTLRICMRVRPKAQPQSAALAMMSPRDTDSPGSNPTTLPVLLVEMCTQILHARHQIVENFLMESLIARCC